jgi:hypothetical protein
MSDQHSPRVPLLSQLPSSSTPASFSGQAADSQQSRRPRSRKASLASPTRSREGDENEDISRSTPTFRSSAGYADNKGASTPDDLIDEEERYEIGANRRGRGEEDEEEDDLIAISGDHSISRQDRDGDDGPSYRQVDGPGLSSGRGMDRATMMRKISVNLALIGSWCE